MLPTTALPWTSTASYDAGGKPFFSSLSIIQAIGMVLLGAGGDTYAEIAAMLGQGGSAPLDDIRHVDTTAGEPVRQVLKEVTFQTANDLWAAADVQLEAAFAEQVRRRYEGLVATVDFADERVVRDRINGWVMAQTDGKIHDLIGRGTLKPRTRLAQPTLFTLKRLGPRRSKLEDGTAAVPPCDGRQRRGLHDAGDQTAPLGHCGWNGGADDPLSRRRHHR